MMFVWLIQISSEESGCFLGNRVFQNIRAQEYKVLNFLTFVFLVIKAF